MESNGFEENGILPPDSTGGNGDVPQISGYLYKKSSAGDWQKRYFETNGTYLTYYKSHKMTKLLAALSLPQVGAITIIGDVVDQKGKGSIFQIDLRDRQYQLRTDSFEETQKWVQILLLLRDHKKLTILPTAVEMNPLNVGEDTRSTIMTVASEKDEGGPDLRRSSQFTVTTVNMNNPTENFEKTQRTKICCCMF